jgi:DNA polymerase family B
MRKDALGLFWMDIPEVKLKKEAPPKRTPPKRVWESPDYLPNLQEALAFNVPYYTDAELSHMAFATEKEPLGFDVESYPNFTQIAFTGVVSGKIIDFIQSPDSQMNLGKLKWLVENFTIIGFNSRGYDMPMLAMMLHGCDCEKIFAATTDIIVNEWPWRDALKKWKVKYKDQVGKVDHIDIIEVAPLFASLKIYNGRMHGELMQDLPVPPGTYVTRNQGCIIRLYCVNDLRATVKLYYEIKDQIDLRVEMSQRYGVDLRSKSDAQIAEAVIAHEIERETGSRPIPPEIPIGTAYKYEVPHFISFKTPLLQRTLQIVRNAFFVVAHHGSIEMPAQLAKLQMTIGRATYTMGIGGLHSTEKTAAYKAGNGWTLRDRDVTSFYPSIMVLLHLFPDHLGPIFLKIFSRILGERVEAKTLSAQFKKASDKQKELIYKVIAAALKIVANGAYGKLGSKYSIIYSPRLLTQVTITGQLSLLMLIERLELAGLQVVSANTDGIVTYCHDTQEQAFLAIIKQWEIDTGFNTEETMYSALYSRDVNNYIALKPDGKFKSKGAFFDPWGQRAEGEQITDECLRKNPQNQICIEAVVKLLRDGTPISHTIRNCTDVTRFVTVRTVTGGAVKVRSENETEYLGKAIRWYYGSGVKGEIVAAKSGNKVPKSDGAVPLLKLPKELPADIDYEWYERETEKLLEWVGYA